MLLEDSFVYLVAVFTSITIFFLAVSRLGLRTRFLRQALREVVQCVGAFVVFLLINLLVGSGLIFLIRGIWRFFPLYTLADAALFILSAFQGFVFHLWWRRSQQQ